MAIKLKQILTQKDIDELREGDVVSLDGITSEVRYCGETGNLRMFSYRAEDKICAILAERKDLNIINDDNNRGKIVLPKGLYEPITYTNRDNGHLFYLFLSRDKELREAGL